MSLKRTVTYPVARKRGRYNKVPIKYGRMKISRSINEREHHFLRNTTWTASINQNLGWNSSGRNDLCFTFLLDGVSVWLGGGFNTNTGLSGSSEFSALFDQYKIAGIKIEAFYSHNNSTGVASNSLPMLHITNDYNDSTTPFSNGDISQYSSCRTVQFNTTGHENNGSIKHFCKPKLASLVYAGVTSGYTEKVAYVDCQYTNVPHYGVKILYDNMATTGDLTIGTIVFRFQYHIVCKNVR